MMKRNFRFYLNNGETIFVFEDEYETWEISCGNYFFLDGKEVVTKIYGAYVMAYERY